MKLLLLAAENRQKSGFGVSLLVRVSLLHLTLRPICGLQNQKLQALIGRRERGGKPFAKYH